MKSTISSVYGSVSSAGQVLDLQVNTDKGPVELALPVEQLQAFFSLFIQLAQQAGEAQGLPASPQPSLYSTAVRIAPSSLGFAVADPSTSALFAHCGVVSFALEMPHQTLLQAAQHVQELLAEGPYPGTPLA